MDFIIVKEKHVPTICLNMIVKNESKIITRLFDSVISIIDTYCICDTGSTDNTVSLIENYFKEKNIKGKIIHHEFINFCINRNYALKMAKDMADYILLLDADMQMIIYPEFKKSDLTNQIYHLQQGFKLNYYNTRLLSNNVEAEYFGVTHEYINIKGTFNAVKLNTLIINDIGDGGSKENKFKRDIMLLTKGLEEEPNNIRYLFYLANSYYDIKEYRNAIKYYEEHAKLVKWNEEKFYNYYRQGLCYKNLQEDEKMIEYLIKAWDTRPTRVESLYELINYYRLKSKWNYCKLYYEVAKQIIYPKSDVLFVHKDIYEYKLLYEYSVFAYYIGDKVLHKEFTKLMNIPNEYNLYNLFGNYKFYYLQLDSIKTIKIEDSFQRTLNNENYRFRSSTPSIIRYKDKYVMNLRYVNYNITPNGTYDWVKNIVSINKFIELSDNLNIDSTQELEAIFSDRKYEGIEDIKLTIRDDKLYFIGTGYKKNNNIGIVGGRYNCKDLINFTEYYKDNECSCEKNWVFIPDTNKIIYKWSPLQICELIDNKLVNMTECNMPNIFNMVRGSANGTKFKDEYWFIVHMVQKSNGEPRYYYHMFVKFDENMKLLGYTCPFKFSKEPIEYCCGIIVEKERIIVSHSIWDRESYIKCYNKKYIDKLFEH